MTKNILNNFGEYTIGLDIGTNSVGWAVINKEYNMLRVKGKDAWGAYLFTQASDAVATRTFRSARKHYNRRRERIRFLQELLNDDVLAKDDAFFIRLKESFLLNKDLDTEFGREQTFNLFNDIGFTDIEYYNTYPTIYHLRRALATEDKQFDPRLIYLALHHIVKYRGNFIYEGKDLDFNGGDIPSMIENFFENLCEYEDIKIQYIGKGEKICDIIKNNTIFKRDKENAITALFAEDKSYKKLISAFAKFIIGNTANIKDCLLIEDAENEEKDNSKIYKFAFKSESYDENEEELLANLGGKSELLLQLKEIYLNIVFGDILSGTNSISEAMIAKYEKHAKDLRVLKTLYRTYMNDKYNDMFRNIKKENLQNSDQDSKQDKKKGGKCNYVTYAGIIPDKVTDKIKRCKREDFYKVITKDLELMPNENEDVIYCINEIKNDTFLLKLNDVSNGCIPYQMNETEMAAIIDNQGKYYPNLAISKDKLLSILTFKRPYYVGTLKGKFSWNKDNNGNIINIEGRITPWNFDDKIDKELISEKFITTMLNFCPYYKNEEVLPKNSIIYQSYVTLNELNKIKIEDKPLCNDWKKDIFLNLMCKKKNITAKNLIDFIKRNYNRALTNDDITGLHENKFNSTMSSLIDFKNKLGENFKATDLDKYEAAIRYITLFVDNKMRYKKLTDLGFNDKEAKSLSALRYTKWGKYSKKFLHENLANGQTILGILFENPKNPHINEILNDESYGFKQILPKDENIIEKFDYKKDIEPLYCSPSVKKAIWNTLNIISEIEKLTGHAPARIFLESTESTEVKKSKDSRVAMLKTLYQSIKAETEYNIDCSNKVTQMYEAKERINSDKLYLWLLQLGKCMYTGESISIDDLTSEKCQIDHIVPRSLIKDDSFENRVLVKTIENQNKSNLVISPIIRSKMQNFWKFLYDKKFMGGKKYKNLMRDEFKDEDFVHFINRQLVETGQTVKAVKQLLLKRYPDSKIECVKSAMNSQFRYKYMNQNKAGFYKIRNLNDFHHAKDAYLTAVVGQFTSVACPLWGQDSHNKYLNEAIKKADKNEDVKRLNRERYGIVLDLMQFGDSTHFEVDENGEYKWNDSYYTNIFANMAKNNCLIVKQKELVANAEFYDQTIYSPKSGKKDLVPLRYLNGKPLPTKLYGGYTSVNPAYFVIVKYLKNKKTEYKFIEIPTMIAINDNNENKKIHSEFVKNYIKKQLNNGKINLESIEIIKKIYKYQLIDFDGHPCYITGESELNSAAELFVLPKYEKLLYLIENRDKSHNMKKLNDEKENYDKLIREFLNYYAGIVKQRSHLYSDIADNMLKIANEDYDKFSYDKKIEYAAKIMRSLSPGAGREDLKKEYGGSSSAGRLSKSFKPDKVSWIDKSCTGLYENIKNGIDL